MLDDEKIKKSAYTKLDESTKRNQIASGHFKSSNAIQLQHNDRTFPPNYLIGGENEVDLNYLEAYELKKQIIAEAIEAYEANKHPKAPKFRAKDYEKSLVVNIKPNTTMQDLKKLAKHFNEKYGFQCYQIAIHRDEGHINKKGEKIINHHAHLEFITLDKVTGKNRWRDIKPTELSIIQTDIAKILEMERGIPKRISQTKRVEPRVWAKIKQQEEENLTKVEELIKEDFIPKKQIITLIEVFRKQCIGKDFPKEFFRDLSDLKKVLSQKNTKITLKDLKSLFENLLKHYEAISKENKKLKENQGKTAENLNFNKDDYTKNLEKIIAKAYSSTKLPQVIKNEIEKGLTADIIDDFTTYINSLEKENQALKAEKIEKSKLSTLESDLKQKEQKNDKTQAEKNKNDLKGNFEAEKGKEIKKLTKEEAKRVKELEKEVEKLKSDLAEKEKIKDFKAFEKIQINKQISALIREKNTILGIDEPLKTIKTQIKTKEQVKTQSQGLTRS